MLVTPSKLGLLRNKVIYHESIYSPIWYASDDHVFSVVKDYRKTILHFVQLADFPPCIVFVFGNYGRSPIRRFLSNISTKYKCSRIGRCSCIIRYPEYFVNASQIKNKLTLNGKGNQVQTPNRHFQDS